MLTLRCSWALAAPDASSDSHSESDVIAEEFDGSAVPVESPTRAGPQNSIWWKYGINRLSRSDIQSVLNASANSGSKGRLLPRTKESLTRVRDGSGLAVRCVCGDVIPCPNNQLVPVKRHVCGKKGQMNRCYKAIAYRLQLHPLDKVPLQVQEPVISGYEYKRQVKPLGTFIDGKFVADDSEDPANAAAAGLHAMLCAGRVLCFDGVSLVLSGILADTFVESLPRPSPVQLEPRQTTLDAMLVSGSQESLRGPGGKGYKLALNRLVKFVVSELLPFSIVSAPSFREFLGTFSSTFRLPDRHRLSDDILPHTFSAFKDKMKKELSLTEFVCFTVDGWTAANMNG